jgi:hypothetical protein
MASAIVRERIGVRVPERDLACKPDPAPDRPFPRLAPVLYLLGRLILVSYSPTPRHARRRGV